MSIDDAPKQPKGKLIGNVRMFTLVESATFLGCHTESILRAKRNGEIEGVYDTLATGHPLMFTGQELLRWRQSRLVTELPGSHAPKPRRKKAAVGE